MFWVISLKKAFFTCIFFQSNIGSIKVVSVLLCTSHHIPAFSAKPSIFLTGGGESSNFIQSSAFKTSFKQVVRCLIITDPMKLFQNLFACRTSGNNELSVIYVNSFHVFSSFKLYDVCQGWFSVDVNEEGFLLPFLCSYCVTFIHSESYVLIFS